MRRIRNRARKAVKHAWLTFRPAPQAPRTLFILGCQRSGTTLLLNIFEQDWNAATYKEFSPLNRSKTCMRLRAFAEVRARLGKTRAPLRVLKPLVESQRARQLLDAFPQGRAVWMFRHYRNVAYSNLERFGPRNGIEDLRPIASEESGDWRAENLPEAVGDFIRERFSEDMPAYEAAVLFWYARNALFFAQKLETHPRVRLCRYRDLVAAPETCVRSLYAWLERPWPGERLVRQVRSNARIAPPNFPLDRRVEEAAQTLWKRLLNIYAMQEKNR